MVDSISSLQCFLLVAAEKSSELPPPTRAVAMMALLAILLLGMLLVVIILLGGNWVRRLGSHRRDRAVPPDRELLRRDVDPEDTVRDVPNQGDTVVDRQSNDTTKH